MKNSTTFWLLLSIASFISGVRCTFQHNEDCYAHSLDKVPQTLLFELGNATFLQLRVPNLNVLDITLFSANNTKHILIKRQDFHHLSIKCGSQPVHLLSIDNYLDLYFSEGNLFTNKDRNVCKKFFSSTKNFQLSFRFENPLQLTFKGFFAFNCFEGCWIYSDMNITIPMTSSEKISLYYKSAEEGKECNLNGVTNITLTPRQWWKKLSIETEEEREGGTKVLLLREESDLLMTKRFLVSTTQFLWTNSSSGVYWTRECVPLGNKHVQHLFTNGIEHFRFVNNRTVEDFFIEDREANKSEEDSYLGTGLSKDAFYQILIFLGCLIFTAVFATVCSLCVSKRNTKKRNETNLKCLDQDQKDKEKKLSNEYRNKQLNKLELPEQENIYELPGLKYPEITTNKWLAIAEINKDLQYYESDDGYMEMRPTHTSHTLGKATKGDPTKSIYESLGSLLDREDHIYETIGGMQHTSIGGMQHTSIGGMQHTSIGEMQHTSIGEMQHTSIGGMKHTSIGGMQHTSIGEMQHTAPTEYNDQSTPVIHYENFIA